MRTAAALGGKREERSGKVRAVTIVGLAVAMVAWVCGSFFGGLSVSSSEQQRPELNGEPKGDSARFYARLMLLCYALALVVVIGWGLLGPTR